MAGTGSGDNTPINLAEYLNPEQLKAALTVDGPLLVIAGAGTGKTRVIEFRALNLVQRNVKPEQILLLTFTRRAASQMISRVARHDHRCAKIQGGTFHSYAANLLRRFGGLISLAPGFTIIDWEDSIDCLDLVAEHVGFYNQKKRTPRKHSLRKLLSLALLTGDPLEKVVASTSPEYNEFVDSISELGTAFTKYKFNHNILDYDDLLLYAKILLENEHCSQEIARMINYVMVDEYQDTNRFEANLALQLATNDNIMVVGDDAQSIYRFKGALHKNIIQFPSRFANCSIITLEKNYRSTQPVLDVSNRVHAQMEQAFEKNLQAHRSDLGHKPSIKAFISRISEAEFLADTVLENRRGGIELWNQAILVRSMRRSFALQTELKTRNIPFEVWGGLKFYETSHVKDILAHLRVLHNHTDELAWIRLLKLLENIGDKRSAEITGMISLQPTLLDACKNVLRGLIDQLPSLRSLTHMLEDWAVRNEDVLATYNAWYHYYKPLCVRKYNEKYRIDDLESLSLIMDSFSSLANLIQELALDPPSSARGIPQPDEERPLILSTIHSAKGMEWECVTILGVEDGNLPSSYSLQDPEEIEEEKRLLYVAITRAKTNLILTMAHEVTGRKDQGVVLRKLSRFLEDEAFHNLLDGFETVVSQNEAEVQEKPAIILQLDKSALLEKLLNESSTARAEENETQFS